jgi:hypothetical protein
MSDGSPDQVAALDQYRQAAPGYDRHMRRFERWEGLAVERLELRDGGDGDRRGMLEAAVGTSGRYDIDEWQFDLTRTSIDTSTRAWNRAMFVTCAPHDI